MKFTIRDLFLVTVIVALMLGWWVDRRTVNAVSDFRQGKFDALEHSVRQAGFEVKYEGDMPVRVEFILHMKDVPTSPTLAPNPPKP